MRAAENLLLHYVSEGPTSRRGTLSRAELAELVRARLATRPAARLEDYLLAPPPEEAFTLSFDDAHASVLAHAAPVLAELGVHATLFVPTAYVGTSEDFLDWDDLERLRDLGWTLGSHGDVHPRMGLRLYAEDEAAHLARLTDELLRSRDEMERALGEAPRLFAYPYGEAPPIAREAARRAGFEAAFTVVADLAHDGDPFGIPRLDPLVARARSETPTDFAVIIPACDRHRIVADVAGRLARQSYPRERFEVVVVDDGSEPPLEALFPDPPSNFRVVRQGDRTFRAGQARQRGVRETRASHLVFLDADVAVEPHFLWSLDWVHRREEDAVLLGYLSGYNLHDLGHLHTPEEVIGRDLTRLPVIPDRSREPTLRACLDNLDWLEAPWPLTYTGNVSLSRSLFERAGGFADEFVGWGLEDVDLGVRLARAGGRFVFGRFALGRHIVDPAEPASRNPFRLPRPTLADFEGYLVNVARLAARHPDDPAVQAYCARSRADIEETCGRPYTVGIELGGAARVRARHHRRVHRVQPGGVPREELLDRVAYAQKVGARAIYLLGGEPTEHPALFDVLRAGEGLSASMQSCVYPFGEAGLAARVRAAGLTSVVALVHALDADVHDDLHGQGAFVAFARGLDALQEAELTRHVHLVVTERLDLARTLARFAERDLEVVELTVLAPLDPREAEAATGLVARVA